MLTPLFAAAPSKANRATTNYQILALLWLMVLLPGIVLADSRPDAPRIPVAPTQTSPEDGELSHPLSDKKLYWAPDSGEGAPDNYEVQLATDSTFLNLMTNKTGSNALPGSQVYLGSFNYYYDTWYYWRVRAIYPGGTTAWRTAAFKTQVAKPGTVYNDSPKSVYNIPLDNITFDWHANGGGPVDTYRLRVATSSSFSTSSTKIDTTFANPTGTLTNSITVGGLTTFYKKHYWKVTATNATGSKTSYYSWFYTEYEPRIALTDPTGGETVDPTGGVLLEWYQNLGNAATSYDVQLALDNQFSDILVDTTVAGGTPKSLLVNGLAYNHSNFYWRARAHAGSTTGNWKDTYFKTSNAPPMAPILDTPAHGTTGQAITNVMFYWHHDTGGGTVDEQEFQLARDSAFANLISDRTGSSALDDTQLNFGTFNLDPDTTYYWRVRTLNTNGSNVSDWTTAVFETGAAPPPVPGVVTLDSPVSEDNQPITGTVLHWHAASGPVDSVRVEVATYSNFYPGNIVVDTTYASPTGALADSLILGTLLTYNWTYYWRVTVINATGSKTSFNQWFKTELEPLVYLDFPRGGEMADPTDGVLLQWHRLQGNPALTYDLQLALDDQFSSLVVDTTVVGDSLQTLLVEGLDYNHSNYYWRVRATTATSTGDWEETYFETSDLPLAAPVLTEPADGVERYPVEDVVYQWQHGYGGGAVEKQEIQVARDSAFTDIVFERIGTQAITGWQGHFEYNNWVLDFETWHWWRVRAINNTSGAQSDWATARFKTRSVLDAVTLAEPADQSQVASATPTLKWYPVAQAQDYDVELTYDILGDSLVTGYPLSLGSTDTTYTVGSLLTGTPYYWRVRATSATSTGDWSDRWVFWAPGTVRPANLSPNAGVVPADTAVVPFGAKLTWVMPTHLDSLIIAPQGDELDSWYDVKMWQEGVSGDTLDINPVMLPYVPYMHPVKLDTYFPDGLADLAVYHWQVRAHFAVGGNSEWAHAWFKTADGSVIPVLVAPADGEAEVSHEAVTFEWKTIEQALPNVIYELQLTDEVVSFTDSLVVHLHGLTEADTVYAFTDGLDVLKAGTSYQWRMRACEVDCYLGTAYPWSRVSAFTTALPRPSLLGIRDAVTGVEVSWPGGVPQGGEIIPILAWTEIPGTTSYEVELAVEDEAGDPDFTNPALSLTVSQPMGQPALEPYLGNADLFDPAVVVDSSRADAMGYEITTGLAQGIKYYWRVRASGGVWSDTLSFTTAPADVARYYYLKDHLGSVRVTVNEQREVVHFEDYYPYGLAMPGRVSDAAGEGPDERYTGHERDSETGFYYARARYYLSELGRWLVLDPLADEYASLSPYNYAANNPLIFVDLTGRCPEHSIDEEGDIVYCYDPEGVIVEAEREGGSFVGYGFLDIDYNGDGEVDGKKFYFDASTEGGYQAFQRMLARSGDEACAFVANEQLSLNARRAALSACTQAGGAAFRDWALNHPSMMALQFALGGGAFLRGVGLLHSSYQGLGKRLFLSETFGITSTRFGHSAALASGSMNQAGSLVKIGWSGARNRPGLNLRVGIGQSLTNSNKALIHFHVPGTFVPNSFANPTIQLKRAIYNAGHRTLGVGFNPF